MVHVHLLIYGEFVLQKRLQELWSRALGEQAFIWATAIRGGAQGIARALREVLKYATKGEKGIRASAERAAAVEVAFRNIKRLSIGGALRKIRIADCEGRSEDAKPRPPRLASNAVLRLWRERQLAMGWPCCCRNC